MPYDHDLSHYASAFNDSYAYGSSEGVYPTADAANFHYPVSGAPIGEYAGAYGGTAETFYNSGPLSAGPSAAGGLVNGMVDNADAAASTFMGAPLLHPPSYGTGVPAYQKDKLNYGQTDPIFDPFRYASSPEDSSSSSSASGDSSIVNWPNDHMPQQFGSFPVAQGPVFGTTRPHGFDASTSTSAYYLSAGLPATASTMPSSAPAPETSHGPTRPAHADANSSNSMPLGINSFAVSANSLSTLPLPGTSNKPPQVQRPVSEVNPDVHRCTLLGEPNTGAAREPTAVNTAPSGLGVTPSDIPTTTTSASQGKRRRAGPEIRERPFGAKPVSPESKYRCYFCGHSSRLQKDHERHEWRHRRTVKDGWFCPGLTSPWCIRSLVRHRKDQGSGSPCYEAAYRWTGLQEIEGAAKYSTAISLRKVVLDTSSIRAGIINPHLFCLP